MEPSRGRLKCCSRCEGRHAQTKMPVLAEDTCIHALPLFALPTEEIVAFAYNLVRRHFFEADETMMHVSMGISAHIQIKHNHFADVYVPTDVEASTNDNAITGRKTHMENIASGWVSMYQNVADTNKMKEVRRALLQYMKNRRHVERVISDPKINVGHIDELPLVVSSLLQPRICDVQAFMHPGKPMAIALMHARSTAVVDTLKRTEQSVDQRISSAANAFYDTKPEIPNRMKGFVSVLNGFTTQHLGRKNDETKRERTNTSWAVVAGWQSWTAAAKQLARTSYLRELRLNDEDTVREVLWILSHIYKIRLRAVHEGVHERLERTVSSGLAHRCPTDVARPNGNSNSNAPTIQRITYDKMDLSTKDCKSITKYQTEHYPGVVEDTFAQRGLEIACRVGAMQLVVEPRLGTSHCRPPISIEMPLDADKTGGKSEESSTAGVTTAANTSGADPAAHNLNKSAGKSKQASEDERTSSQPQCVVSVSFLQQVAVLFHTASLTLYNFGMLHGVQTDEMRRSFGRCCLKPTQEKGDMPLFYHMIGASTSAIVLDQLVHRSKRSRSWVNVELVHPYQHPKSNANAKLITQSFETPNVPRIDAELKRAVDGLTSKKSSTDSSEVEVSDMDVDLDIMELIGVEPDEAQRESYKESVMKGTKSGADLDDPENDWWEIEAWEVIEGLGFRPPCFEDCEANTSLDQEDEDNNWDDHVCFKALLEDFRWGTYARVAQAESVVQPLVNTQLDLKCARRAKFVHRLTSEKSKQTRLDRSNACTRTSCPS